MMGKSDEISIDEIGKKMVYLKNAIQQFKFNLQNKIAQNIKKNRAKLKMSQEDLSLLTGISRPQIANLESGNHATTVSNLIVICKALDTTPNDLMEFGSKVKE